MMTTFIKTKFNTSDDQTSIDKYKVAAKITEYQNNLPKFIEKRQPLHVKMYVTLSKIKNE